MPSTTPEGRIPLTFECKPDNPLPEILRSAGYQISSGSQEERFLPCTETLKDHSGRKVERQHLAPTMVDIFHLRLP